MPQVKLFMAYAAVFANNFISKNLFMCLVLPLVNGMRSLGRNSTFIHASRSACS